MRIPWAPVTSSDGVKPPTNDVLYDKTYRTASNSVSHKAFQNLPMNTAAPAVRFEEPNPKGRYGSTKIREHGEGAGENYVDSFVTHPIPGNYASIVATLEIQREEIRNAVYKPVSLAQVAEWGYRNLGANADEEKYNSLRDRLRFSGASDEEIELILKERKKQTLLAALDRPLSVEQRQILQAEDAARAAIGVGAIRADRADPLGARPPADTNVFDFGNPGPAGYINFNQMAQPGNQIYAGAARSGINRPGYGRISSSDTSDESGYEADRFGRRGRPRGARDRTGRTRATLGERAFEEMARQAAEEAAREAAMATTTSKGTTMPKGKKK